MGKCIRQPQIVSIQERNPIPLANLYADITRYAGTVVSSKRNVSYEVSVIRQRPTSAISGTIVYYDDLSSLV
jgi:hypothetical protein